MTSFLTAGPSQTCNW